MTNECKERKELGYYFSLLGEDFGPVSNDENITDKYIWYYSIKETDFFLEKIKFLMRYKGRKAIKKVIK